MASLDALSNEAMTSILTEPKNALVKQYQKLLAMDGVELSFESAALDQIVAKARALGTGARGLRAVMESTMLDVMFDVHDRPEIGACVITEGTVTDGHEPLFVARKASA